MMVKTFSHDTSQEATEQMTKMYFKLSDEEKLRKCSSFLTSAKRIAYSSIKSENPNLSETEIPLAVFSRIYKHNLSEKFMQNFENIIEI